MSVSITVQPSGRSFGAESGEFVLSAAIRQGVGLPYGCKDGACGACKCRLISGSVEHGSFQEKALSADEQARGLILACRALPQGDLVIESRQVVAAGALPIRKMPVRVTTLERASPDVMVLQLQMPASDAFEYRAGQYLEFILKDGTRRAYSMANAPHDQAARHAVELHIRHMPGGLFTDQVFGSMKEKDILRIEGPFGSFHLREDSPKPVILLASGTGFAPIKAILSHMQHQGMQRPVSLYWGGRRPADLYQSDWVRAEQAAMPHLQFVPVISDALPEDGWQGRTGFVHQAVLQDFADLSGHEVYACGAPVVVESARRDYLAAGLPEEAFFADAFTSAKDKL